ncbi:MAG: short-chain dehydrogenase [Bacteroidetes bacterium GWF2_42_66]|nr:MAG: short-chain dehydrogenase [Bacteroidetes bacterium GWA2_42_15]OFX96128.1 MAG: short-chain dehydrogenase [Bacteroidetes bacterium GWE2_42_39]OFY45186.1 MAG: short-chain dehydrogenase [Bacteroidetes bacterium GWF2_42_66]
MQNQINKIIPAVRMMLSADSLKTVKFFAEGELYEPVKSIESLVVDNSDHVLTELSEKIKSAGKKIEAITIKGFGTLLVADYPKGNGRVEQRIAIVTGGAQGFGAGIVEHLMQNGANVVVADLNAEKGQEFVDELNATKRNNKALFVKTNVADAASVENLIAETVKEFGGLDLFISNAGILRAGSLDEMTPETFELMTKVNYSAYFICAKYASKVLKVQNQWKPDHFTDIIQINSKSGLKGSNKNFAYAGGKFGGIGLTQSFALELMPYRIKVNSVCPGNFFDGPLWADPETGLFVQYLRAGKVPGAKTIDDVKRFYEAQVPAGRGCTPLDVMRAVYYIIEQEYETGQAVPVTGGQNMLN